MIGGQWSMKKDRVTRTLVFINLNLFMTVGLVIGEQVGQVVVILSLGD